MTPGQQLAILVVEDNGALRRLIVRVLSGSGFSVLEAANASQGLELFRSYSPLIALAIIDMVMPGMSGLDLAAELDRLRPGMKILYTSGHVSSVAMESIAQRSPDRVLFKPFDGNELLNRVIHLVGSGAAASETIAAMAEPTSSQSENAWNRLIEASDRLDSAAVEVIGYRDTSAAFAVAAAHSAALRAAGLGYAFRTNSLGTLPFALFVAARDLQQARELIERVGLGVDVVQPA